MPGEWNRTMSDMLQELGNIGSGNALTALSKLTSTEFIVRVPEIELLDYSAMPGRLGDPEEETIGVMLDVSEGIHGIFLLLLRPEIAEHILVALGSKPEQDFYKLDPVAGSSLLELGNIMCSSYMNAISQMTGLEFRMSVPSYAVDMLGAILSLPIIRFAEAGSQILFIQNVFTIEGKDWVGSMLLLPSADSAERLTQHLEALI